MICIVIMIIWWRYYDGSIMMMIRNYWRLELWWDWSGAMFGIIIIFWCMVTLLILTPLYHFILTPFYYPYQAFSSLFYFSYRSSDIGTNSNAPSTDQQRGAWYGWPGLVLVCVCYGLWIGILFWYVLNYVRIVGLWLIICWDICGNVWVCGYNEFGWFWV